MIYCIVPRDLADTLHEPLRAAFADDPTLDVVVERRNGERRRGGERRGTSRTVAEERRRIRNESGRRVGDRRAIQMDVVAPALPDFAAPYEDRVVFVERIEPSSLHEEDLDSARMAIRVQAGELEAFDVLYLRYYDRVYGYVRVLLRDAHEAEDVTQHAFMRTLEAIGRYEQRGRPFRAWLFRIVRNAGLDLLRSQKRLSLAAPDELDSRREGPDPDLSTDPLERIADRDLLRLIERLPELQRQVVVLQYMLGLRASEVAEVIDHTPAAVRRLESLALAQLEHRLEATSMRAH